jgi:tetratricopeptide (TPR) repeat protein
MASTGNVTEKAVEYSVRAGDRARELFAWEEAATHFQRALEVIDLRPAPDERPRIDLLLALAEAWLSEGGNDQARKESALRAADVARQIGDRERFARAVLSFAGPHREDGVLDPQLVALIEEALALIGREDSGPRAMLLVRLSIALWFAAERERQRMKPLNEEAFAMARRLGDRQALAYVLARGVWAWDAGNTEEQIANAREMLALAAEAENKSMALEAYTILVGPLLEVGDRDGADAAIDAYIELQHEVRKPGWAMTWRAMQADLDGRLTDVESLATQGYAELQKANENAGIGFGSQIMGLRLQQGRGMEMEATMKDMLSDRLLVIRAAVLGLTYAEADRLDDAHAAFEEAAFDDFASVPFDRNWTLTMSFLADVCTFLRDARRADILYELMRPYQHRCIVVTTSCIALTYAGSLHRPLGGLATAMSRWADAERHYEAAIAMHQRMRARGWLTRTQCDHAAMLIARGALGDRERAVALLREALAFAKEAGMAKVASDAEALLARM